MADAKLSALSAAAAVADADLFYTTQSSVSLKQTASALKTYVLAGLPTGTSGHVVPYLDGNNTWSGVNVLGAPTATSVAIGGATLGANALAVTGHLLFEGVTSTGATGTGKLVFDGTPTLVTPVLGVATGTSLALGGATIGSNALAVTGSIGLPGGGSFGSNGQLTVGSNSSLPNAVIWGGIKSQGDATANATFTIDWTSPPSLAGRSTAVIGFTAGAAATAAMDSAWSRISANVTGFGNGTQGDVSGTIQAATFKAGTSIIFTTDNTGDIGASGATRPRDFFLGRNETIGGSSTIVGALTAQSSTAIPAGGTAGSGLMVSSTANFGVFFGSGAPTLSAAKGSLYLRSDGTGVADRAYINSNGSTTWTALTTAG